LRQQWQRANTVTATVTVPVPVTATAVLAIEDGAASEVVETTVE
jgi:hypothetical protein